MGVRRFLAMINRRFRESKDTETLFTVDGFVEVYENEYETGEDIYVVNEYPLDIKGNHTIDNLLKQLSHYGFSDEITDYNFWTGNGYSEITSYALLNEDDVEPSKKEYDDWENGKIKLHSHRLSAHIRVSKDLDEDDAKKYGFQLY